MKHVLRALAVSLFAISTLAQEPVVRRIRVADYVDRMKAGWIGQMAGVGWGAPTEFKFQGRIIPPDQMPKWTPGMVNQFQQDDLYVEMTFLRTLEVHGLDCSIAQAGIDFANSGYPLWHANDAGRKNLRAGIAPPDSGHPRFNQHADDIDYQIEADFSGLISPGLPNNVIVLGEKFGRLMNYGDGVYAGQFTGAMYAAAFFETSPEKLVEVGLAAIPGQSQYAECIGDTLKWYRQNPDNWEKTWELLHQKYDLNKDYRRFSCDKGSFNIDAKLNGAYIVLGLLYGKGDIGRTIDISCRAGQDSDCNPSSAAGILCTTLGMRGMPDKFISALDNKAVFSHTVYSFPALVSVCEKLARQGVVKAGGRIERDAQGDEVFIIPVKAPVPSAFEQCWNPGQAREVRFTPEQMSRIKAPAAGK